MFENLLPHIFKKIGQALFGLCILMLILTKNNLSNQLENAINVIGLIGFGLLMNSKEKDEDEGTVLCRFKAIRQAIKFGLIMLIFPQILQLYDANPTPVYQSFLNISFLIYYLNFEYFNRQKRNEKQKLI